MASPQAEAIKEQGLDRVVVAACSPSLHEPTFRSCLEREGLNPYMVEMANIREQCSWVHTDRDRATEKAFELVDMARAKVAQSEPLFRSRVPVTKRALVIGGGISGIQAAIDIGMAGHEAVIVERDMEFRRTHSTRELLGLLAGQHIALSVSEDEMDLMDSIYVPSKYPVYSALPQALPDPAICRVALDIARKVKDLSTEILKVTHPIR